MRKLIHENCRMEKRCIRLFVQTCKFIHLLTSKRKLELSSPSTEYHLQQPQSVPVTVASPKRAEVPPYSTATHTQLQARSRSEQLPLSQQWSPHFEASESHFFSCIFLIFSLLSTIIVPYSLLCLSAEKSEETLTR